MRSKTRLVRVSIIVFRRLRLRANGINTELENLPDLENDLDVDVTEDPGAASAYLNDPRNKRKVKEASDNLQINIIHLLREGKRLLVLDIDYSQPIAIACSDSSHGG